MCQLVNLPVDTTYHPKDFKTSMHKSNQIGNFYVCLTG